VVHRVPPALLLVALEHRKIDHPQRAPGGFREAAFVADLEPQRAERVVDDFGLVGAEKHQIAVARAGALEDLLDDRGLQELQYRRLQTLGAFVARVHFDVGEAFRPVHLHELGVGVDLSARKRSAAGKTQRRDAAALRLRGFAEDLELHVLHEVRQLGQRE
jgi:hypothetical protein